MATLNLQHIDKIYDNHVQAVFDFNLDVKDGELIVLVGPSGCGKSTTLRMVAGLEDISAGKLLLDGKDITATPAKDRDMAMVFQSYALYGHMTIYENMAFSLTLRKENPNVIHKKVMAAADILGLTSQLNKKPAQLSGGQRQRVAIGRAIIRKVGVFLMDEPLSNLDAKQRVTMRSEIAQIHRETGATTIYVTHDQTEAMTLADRIVVMKDGYVQQTGTPYELYHNPVNVFVAGFIGEPPMNFIRARVKGGRIPFGPNTLDVASRLGDKAGRYEGKEIVFGFRPESIELGAREDAYQVDAQVELTEMLGDNANVYITAGEDKAILKVDPHDTPDIDAAIRFSIPYEHVHLFDGETEEVIEKALEKSR